MSERIRVSTEQPLRDVAALAPHHLVAGIAPELFGVDRSAMIWPVAALAVFLLGFAVVYGSVLQSRLETNEDPKDSG